MGNDVNIGKYTDNDFQESESVTYIAKLLEGSKRIIAHFNKGDKGPNVDGRFELLHSDKYPKATFEVQIKSTENLKNGKYVCDTKIMNYVKNSISLNPVILFIYCVSSNSVYWKYISIEYINSLKIGTQKSKTLILFDEDILNISNFIEKMDEIYNHKLVMKDSQQALLTSNIGFKDKYEDIQFALDYINKAMDEDLRFIKERLFPDCWKFGIAYTEKDDNYQFSVYIIRKGYNDVFIKDFDLNCGLENGYIRGWNKDGISVIDLAKDWLEKIVKLYFEVLFIDVEFIPTEILEDIVYTFLDNISFYSSKIRLESKNGYKESEIETSNVHKYVKGLYNFIIYVFQKDTPSGLESCKTMLVNQYGRNGYFDPRIVFNMNNCGNLYITIVDEEKSFDGIKYNFNMTRDITLVLDSVEELSRRGITRVKRNYPLSSRFDRDIIEKQRTKNQLQSIAGSYLDVVSSIFKGTHQEFSKIGNFDVYIDELGIKYGLNSGEFFNISLVGNPNQVKSFDNGYESIGNSIHMPYRGMRKVDSTFLAINKLLFEAIIVKYGFSNIPTINMYGMSFGIGVK